MARSSSFRADGEVALCLQHQKLFGRAGGKLPLLCVERALRQLACAARRVDALPIRLYLTRRLSDLRRHLQLLALELGFAPAGIAGGHAPGWLPASFVPAAPSGAASSSRSDRRW